MLSDRRRRDRHIGSSKCVVASTSSVAGRTAVEKTPTNGRAYDNLPLPHFERIRLESKADSVLHVA